MPSSRFRTKMVKKLRLVSLITLFQQNPLHELNKYGPCAVRTSAIDVGTWDFYKMISPDFVRGKLGKKACPTSKVNFNFSFRFTKKVYRVIQLFSALIKI